MLSAKRGHWEEKYLKYKGKYLALSQQNNSIGGGAEPASTVGKFKAVNILPYVYESHATLGKGKIQIESDYIPFVNNVVDLYTSLPRLLKNLKMQLITVDTFFSLPNKPNHPANNSDDCDINEYFCTSENKAINELSKYIFVQVIGGLINLSVYYVLVTNQSFDMIDPILALAVSSLCSMAFTYTGSRKLVFINKTTKINS